MTFGGRTAILHFLPAQNDQTKVVLLTLILSMY